jgi:hypothetical protein
MNSNKSNSLNEGSKVSGLYDLLTPTRPEETKGHFLPMKNTSPNAARSASVFGCTVEQARSLMARNSVVLSGMALKAKRTGKKVNGYTSAQLAASAADYCAASK